MQFFLVLPLYEVGQDIKMKTFPLLQSQMGVVLACSKHTHSTCYNLPGSIPYPREIDAGRLAVAIRKVIAARPAMRICLVRDGKGCVRQYVDEEMTIPVIVRHVAEDEVSAYLRQGFVRPFDLFCHEPLCRFEVLATEEHCWLLWDFHHVIADGITIAHHFIGRDLPAAYTGEELVVKEPRLFQQAKEEMNFLGGMAYQKSREYFLSTFESMEMTLLGVQPSSSALETVDFADAKHRVPTCSMYVSRTAVDAWCKKHHARTHSFLMTVFNIVLAKFCHTRHLAYATLFHGRTDRQLRDAYGMFVKTLPIACVVNPTDRVEEAVAEVQRCLFSAIRHSAYPYTHFCHDMQAAPGITFAYQGENILEQVSLDGKPAKGVQLERDAMDGELSCVVYCQDDKYEIRTEAIHNDGGPDWAVLVAQAMKNGVEYVLCHPKAFIGDVDIVSEEEKTSLLLLSQGEQMAVDNNETWLGGFLRQVRISPEALAVSDGITSLTYGELEQKSAAVATGLLQESVGNGDLIGVEAIPCTAFLVAVIGVMRSGAAYVPLDPQWPDSHRQTIIEDAQLKKIISINSIDSIATITTIETITTMPRLDDAAYVIYTSGTTGRPKGVVIPHRALHNLVCFIVKQWRLSASSRISCHSSLAFDGSVEDLFPVLTIGGAVYIMPEEVRRNPDALHRFIDQHQITGGCYTTAMAPLLAARQYPSLDYVCLGGEKLLRHPGLNCRVFNTYGPTEFTVNATYHELSLEDETDIPIGRPLPNCAAYVTDIFGMLLPKGAVGELCLQGPQMALGYLHDAVLTAEIFTNCSFTDGTVYHTGDLVRWDELNLLHYVSRQDRQVKVNGYRISLDEVESHIASLVHIRQVAVIFQTKGSHEVLCAFFTADREVSAQQIKEALRDKCPDYMIPAIFVQMGHLPLTTLGKVDYKKLHISHLPKEKCGFHHQMPENELEHLFCRIFAKVLDMEDFDVTDDFFQLGGTSILVMRVMMEAEEVGVHIQYGDVFRYSTPQLLARKINSKEKADNRAIEEYDYTPLHRFLSNPSNLDNPITPRNILLTGVTGFLGAHVLWQLLNEASCGRDTSCSYILCVIRAASETEAWERLEDTWRYYFGLPFEDRMHIQVVAGDLTDDGFLQSLDDKAIDMVVNCAADVRHFAQRDTLFEVNSKAVSRLADFCVTHHVRLIHVSTLSVAGFSSTGIPLPITDHELYVGQVFHEQYSLSKFMGERALLERMAFQGLNAQIVRIGNLTTRQSDGRFQRHPERNAFAMALQMMAEKRVMPQSAVDMEVDVSPVDVVAKELTDLIYGDTSVGVVHLTHPHKGGLPDLLKKMTGRPVSVVDDDEFKRRCGSVWPIAWLL